MAATYTPIATTTLGSATTSYSFTSIPTTYTDLILITQLKNATTTANIQIQVGNGSADTGTNYSFTNMYGLGSSSGSGAASNQNSTIIGTTFTEYGTQIVNFQNYSNTTTYKTILSRSGQGGNNTTAWVNLWRSVSAINYMTIYLASGIQMSAGSTLTLYGIKAA